MIPFDHRWAGPDWCIWKSDDILLVVRDPLDQERWALLMRYVSEVLRPSGPTWNDQERMGFGFVGVGENPLHDSAEQ